MKYRILRMLLFFSAFVWGISVFGVVVPWDKAVEALNGLGAGAIPHDPMLEYWLRMAAGAFTGVGIFFLVLAINPRRYANVIPLAAGLMFGEGVVLLVSGLRLGLRPFPFYADTAACLAVAAGIIILAGEARSEEG